VFKTFEPGTLVRLSEQHENDLQFTVGNIDASQSGWKVKHNSVAMIIKLLKHIPDVIGDVDNDVISYVVLVDGRTGWVYHEDCTEIVTQ